MNLTGGKVTISKGDKVTYSATVPTEKSGDSWEIQIFQVEVTYFELLNIVGFQFTLCDDQFTKLIHQHI